MLSKHREYFFLVAGFWWLICKIFVDIQNSLENRSGNTLVCGSGYNRVGCSGSWPPDASITLSLHSTAPPPPKKKNLAFLMTSADRPLGSIICGFSCVKSKTNARWRYHYRSFKGGGVRKMGGYVAPKNEGTTQFNDFKMRAGFF